MLLVMSGCDVCGVGRQLAGSRWLEKKFIEKMLTEQLTSDEVHLLMLCDNVS